MANRVVHFEIEAKDLERAKKFYIDAFGWKMEQMGSDMGNYTVVTTGDPKKPGGINGGIFTTQGDEEKLNAYACVISVDDIDKAISDVKAAGGEVYSDKQDIPGVGIFVKCRDTEGNRFSLLQPSPEMTNQK